ncbi:uncharacterized protein LOC129616392 [Condylostylus longicornis]|uniref:uncharacterized protein LOC129616392 n=1 Tax=Condylostylus longicornis TaxID=2530218 RepID=UPI00244DE841|nr:uncharacterized protein LOC129616392 [Condylostylus longicornis]
MIWHEHIEKGISPEVLKMAIVVPLHKKSAAKDLNNYRPISLLSIFSKLNDMSTENVLLKFCGELYRSLNFSKVTVALFIDIKRAFDMVDHNVLLDKLHNIGFRGPIHYWFSSYLARRSRELFWVQSVLFI